MVFGDLYPRGLVNKNIINIIKMQVYFHLANTEDIGYECVLNGFTA